MEKNEQNRKSSPGGRSTTRRNIFSSIINFSVSQGAKVNGGSTTASTAANESPANIGLGLPNKWKQEPSEFSARKKKPDQLSISASKLPNSSSCSSINSGNNNNNSLNASSSTLLGQAPKTFSVLTALNELEVSTERRNHRSISTGALVYSSPGKNSDGLPSEFAQVIKGRARHEGHSGGLPGPRKANTLAHRPKSKSSLDKDFQPETSRGSKSKERTPDWVWKIFQLGKHGRLDDLKTALAGLDPALVRHLADPKGNTLLHCAARGGHLNTLQWLVSILGIQTEAALSDQNSAGRTVILTTLKSGQVESFQWLVLHTNFGDNALVPSDGKWSLLHFAAKYGNVEAVRWLCQQLLERQVKVDLQDCNSWTPLHVAAKWGHIGVSQELIRAGADPLCQTELSWLPSDLAFRHHRLECANYFIMAEAAGSLGKELHSILMEFTTLHHQQETLRTHFRDVLRVAKWLMKERGDLVKQFAPNGTNSSPPAAPLIPLLLGGTTNGVRLSELEHSLVLAEQGWKKIESNRVDTTFPFGGRDYDLALQNTSTADLLQSRLFASHARQDKNVASGAMMSAASSEDEDESSLSAVTSGDEESATVARLKPSLRRKSGTGLVSNSPIRSTPWLLESDDSILAALSPSKTTNRNSGQYLPKLDLLRVASTSTLLQPRTGQPNRNSSSSENSPGVLRSKGFRHSEGDPNSNAMAFSAAVLEVIEPLQTSTKQYGSPGKNVQSQATLSLSPASGHSISLTALNSSLSSPLQNEQHQMPWTTTTTRRAGKLYSKHGSESQLSPSVSATTMQKDFEEIYLAPDLIQGTRHQGGRNFAPLIGRVMGSQTNSKKSIKTSESGVNEIYSPSEGNHFATFHSKKSHSTDGSLAVGPKGGNFSRAHISSTLSGSSTTMSDCLSVSKPITPVSDFGREVFHDEARNVETVPGFQEQQGNSILSSTSSYVSVSPSSVERNYGTSSLTILPLESSDSPVSPLPVIQQLQLQKPQLTLENGAQCGGEMDSTLAMVDLSHDSSSTSNTPIMLESHSSVSVPSADLFPFTKESWTLVDDHEDEAVYVGGQLSPTPSESSRTESAVVPPLYHTSEASKPDFALGQQQDCEESSRLLLLGSKDDEGGDETKRNSSEEEDGSRLERALKMREDDNKTGDWDSDKNCLESRSHIVKATPCIIRQRLSTPIHKTPTHHRVKKSSRGKAKPWYEIDGSDDDEGSLLRVTRARSRSSCHSTYSLSGAEESGSEEMSFCDDTDGHECDSASCSRHNCPDFV